MPEELTLHEDVTPITPLFTPETFAEMISANVASKLAEMAPANAKVITRRMTLRELMDLWLESYAKLHCKQWKGFESEFRLYLSSIADMDIHHLKRSDVMSLQANLHKEVGKHAANAATTLLSMLYNKALEWELFDGRSPASNIRKFRVKSRDRFLQPEELAPWFAAVNSLRSENTRDLLLMLLYTGARRTNVSEMKWDDISETFKVWRIEETKNGESQIIPLIQPAMEIIERRRGCHPIWVFPKQDGSGPVKSLSQAWLYVLERADLENLRIHDLRRSMGSWQAINGVSMPIIGRTLNHKSASSTMIYARLHLDPVRSAMEDAVNAMFEAAGREKIQIGSRKQNHLSLPRSLFKTVDPSNLEERVCKQCGTPYTCRKRSRSLYCRNGCKQQAKRQSSKAPKPIIGQRQCDMCSRTYSYRSTCSKYCSDSCRARDAKFRMLRKLIKENRTPNTPIVVWQDGLGVREDKKGTTYLCKIRLSGKQVMFTLGHATEMSLSEAKTLVKRAQIQSQSGLDPRKGSNHEYKE